MKLYRIVSDLISQLKMKPGRYVMANMFCMASGGEVTVSGGSMKAIKNLHRFSLKTSSYSCFNLFNGGGPDV